VIGLRIKINSILRVQIQRTELLTRIRETRNLQNTTLGLEGLNENIGNIQIQDTSLQTEDQQTQNRNIVQNEGSVTGRIFDVLIDLESHLEKSSTISLENLVKITHEEIHKSAEGCSI